MKQPLRIVFVAVLALATLLVFTAGGGSASPNKDLQGKPIVIAMPLALTGIISFYDTPNLAGAQIAVDQINKKGGVLKRPLKIISADTKSDLGLIAGVANSLLDKGADVMIPTLDYDFGGPSARAANARKIPAISEAGDSRFGLQGIGRYLFNQFPAGSEAAIGFRAIALGLDDARVDPARTEHGAAELRTAHRELVREALRERDDGVLRDAVDPGARDEAGHRGGVHDVAFLALRDHLRHEAADAVDDAHQVDAHHPAPLVERALPRRLAGAAAGDAGVVAEDVDGAERIERLARERFHGVRLRDVADDGGDGSARLLQRVGGFVERLRLDVREHHLHAVRGEPRGHALADAARRSGHDGDAVLELLHRVLLRRARHPSRPRRAAAAEG